MPPKLRSALRRRLLHWYDKHKRDLPWRRTRDPYAVWISETMLQQTRVAVVIPYYEKFLARFPTVAALAHAPLPRVLRLWSGLGYYRRAENLHRAARQIVERHGGKLPPDFAALRALSGIGDYTAGALMSIAFDEPYPAIDGNVRRVIGRLLAGDERQVRSLVEELVPAVRPGEFNQALMELGATICTPKNPLCERCPLRSLCASQNRAAVSTMRRKQIKFKSVLWPLVIVRRHSRILLHRRSGGLLRGLWEIPGGEITGREPLATALRRHLQDLGLTVRPKRIGVIRHTITYRRIRAPLYLVDLDGGSTLALPNADWRWIEHAKLSALATSSMTTKAHRFLFAHEEALR